MFSSQENSFITMYGAMFTRLNMAIILQYIQISNYYTVHLQLIYAIYYSSKNYTSRKVKLKITFGLGGKIQSLIFFRE